MQPTKSWRTEEAKWSPVDLSLAIVDPDAEEVPSDGNDLPTLWGLMPVDLHDRFWAARGVQVVRLGQRSQIIDNAELYLLTDPNLLSVFSPARIAERLYWASARLAVVRLRDQRQMPYVERIITDNDGNFERYERVYTRKDTRRARVAFTNDRLIADAWQTSKSPREGWRVIRHLAGRTRRLIDCMTTPLFDAEGEEAKQFVCYLQSIWPRPDVTIGRCIEHQAGVWIDPSSKLDPKTVLDGRAWIGAGRVLGASDIVLGPAILWDDRKARPEVTDVRWQELEPTEATYRQAVGRAQQVSWFSRALKRGFDVVFALLVLFLTLPLFPLVMLAIWLEDGRPFFFGHVRETLGGREFHCWKFRSMRKDAEQLKQQYLKDNQADGPQFYIAEDPRLTRVGRVIRKLNIDELPQFFNVLRGHMSVVGPRPSPRRENQFCPPWREARLSVRPGITGLWQVMRTRRPGMDFQEWIKYDLEYVQNASLLTDLGILWQTINLMLRGKL